MPMIKKSNEERCYALLKGNIFKRMEVEQVTDKQMAAVTGMHPGTFAQKKNHPERFFAARYTSRPKPADAASVSTTSSFRSG